MKSNTEWIGLSDMMTGLMLIFLFISILYIEKHSTELKKCEQIGKFYTGKLKKCEQKEKSYTGKLKKLKELEIFYMEKHSKELKKYKQIEIFYIEIKNKIYQKLYKAFSSDLKKWNAELNKDSLTIRFLSPQIMFTAGKSTIKPKFKTILNNFCPRYFKILSGLKNIKEIRIEGHTSKEWLGQTLKNAYFKNMKLSQDRTRSVLEHCINIYNSGYVNKNWIKDRLTANGLSSSQPLCTEESTQCRTLNRRVDFRIQIDLKFILDAIRKNN